MEWLGVDLDHPSACYLYLDGQYVSRNRRQSHSRELIKCRRCWVSESSLAQFLFGKLVVTGEKALLLPSYLEPITDASR